MPDDNPVAAPKNKGGHPRANIDLAMVYRAASIGCPNDEIAALCGVGRQTIYDRVRLDPEFAAALERGRDEGKATLRRRQWQLAMAGNPTMLIWLGKQMLDQRDKHEHSGDPERPVVTEVVYRWATPQEIRGRVVDVDPE